MILSNLPLLRKHLVDDILFYLLCKENENLEKLVTHKSPTSVNLLSATNIHHQIVKPLADAQQDSHLIGFEKQFLVGKARKKIAWFLKIPIKGAFILAEKNQFKLLWIRELSKEFLQTSIWRNFLENNFVHSNTHSILSFQCDLFNDQFPLSYPQ